jgi:orotate phosphoribosyltransferase
VTAAEFLEIVAGRRGHFRLESGHHSALWLDLDPLFSEPRKIEPFVSSLAEALRPHDVEVVCGPLLGGAFLAQLLSRALEAQFCFTERVMPAGRDGLYRAQYLVPPALVDGVRGKRVALVDDVMSAGSALRGTHAELVGHGAVPVVVGALLVLGKAGADYFAEKALPVEAVARDDYDIWFPGACPLCALGTPLEDVAVTSPAS